MPKTTMTPQKESERDLATRNYLLHALGVAKTFGSKQCPGRVAWTDQAALIYLGVSLGRLISLHPHVPVRDNISLHVCSGNWGALVQEILEWGDMLLFRGWEDVEPYEHGWYRLDNVK
jgi:hypothetical protein